MSRLKTLITLLILSLFISCSGEPPEIVQVVWQRNSVKDASSGLTRESLSIFVHVVDEDGEEDISELYLINDKEEIYFRISEDSLIKKERSGEIWAGSNGFTMPEGLPVPGGIYRILVIDKAGERDEREIYIAPPEKDIRFPSITVKDSNITLGRQYSRAELLVFDTQNSYLGSKEIAAVPVAASSLPGGRDKLSYCYVYLLDERTGYGVLTGPYSLTD